jgi:hypothetical protein
MKNIVSALFLLFVFQTWDQRGGQDQDQRAWRRRSLHHAPGRTQRVLNKEGFDAEVIVIAGSVANVALSNGDAA